MRSMRDICVGLVLIYSPLVHPQLIARIEGGRVTDVGPEAGLVFSNASQAFLIRGRDEAVASSGRAGLYKTTDGGKTWVRSMSGLVDPATGVEPYVQGLCQSPSSPEIGYAVTIQDGLASTNDFGESWSPPTRTNNPQLTDCAVDPVDPAVVYALASTYDPARPGLLFKSVNGGLTFSTVGDGLPADRSSVPSTVVVAPTDRDRIYAAVVSETASLFSSSDGGLTFEPLPNAPLTAFLRIYPHPTVDGTLLVAGGNDLFLSTDGGTSFTRVGAGLPAQQFVGMLAFDSTDPTIVYAAQGVNGFYRSEDGAQTFVRVDGLSEHALLGIGVNKVAVTPPSEKGAAIYVGSSLGPYRSDDMGKSFTPIHAGYRGTQVNDLAIDAAGRLLVATINSAGVFRSTKDGAYETIGETLPQPFIIGVQAVAAAPDDPDLYLVSGADNNAIATIFRTTDGGHSWPTATIIGPPVSASMRIAFAPSDSRRVYAVFASSGFLRSVDGGQIFERRSFPLSRAIAVDPANPDVIYASGGQGLFKSVDGGETFQQVANGDFIAIAIDLKHPQTVYAASRTTNAVIRSLDGGQTFSSMAVGGDRALGLGIDPLPPERVFAWMHAGGLFRSEDGGDSWLAVDSDEARRRSTAQAGLTALAVAPDTPARVYFGNGSVLQFVDD